MMNELLKDVKFENFKEKDQIVRQLVSYMLDRTQGIFIYKNLPDTIPARNLELILQTRGCAGIAKVNDDLYAFFGGLGGEPNAYYEPTIFTVANPYLNFNKNLKIDEDVIIVRNDALYLGLMPLFVRYASLMAENAISLRLCDINTRIKQILAASDDRTKAAADLFFEHIESGELGAIAEQPLLESLNVYSTAQGQTSITELIEYEQYLKASWFNEIGLNANYNMKREAILSGESELNDDMLLPLIDDMLYSRKEGIKKINEMFETDIEVELNSVWKKEQMIQLTEAPDITDETSENPEEEKAEWKEDDVQNIDGSEDEEDVSKDNINNSDMVNDSGTDRSDDDKESEENAGEDDKAEIEDIIQEDIDQLKEDIEEIKDIIEEEEKEDEETD